MITGFGSKCCLSTMASCSKDLSLGNSGDSRLRNSANVLQPVTESKMATCFSSLMSLALKNSCARSTYVMILSFSGSNSNRCPKLGILAVARWSAPRHTPRALPRSYLRRQSVVYPSGRCGRAWTQWTCTYWTTNSNHTTHSGAQGPLVLRMHAILLSCHYYYWICMRKHHLHIWSFVIIVTCNKLSQYSTMFL